MKIPPASALAAANSETIGAGWRSRKRIVATGATAIAAMYAAICGDVISDTYDHLARHSATEAEIEEAVSKLGANVMVRCMPLADIQRPGTGTTNPWRSARTIREPLTGAPLSIRLNDETCEILASLSQGDGEAATNTAASALQSLAHESRHAAGIREEGVAECQGAQLVGQAAQAFGVPVEQADELQERAAADFTSTIHDEMNLRALGEYRIPAGCYRGGPLDLGLPGKTIFPEQGRIAIR